MSDSFVALSVQVLVMGKGLAPRLEGCQRHLMGGINPLHEPELLTVAIKSHEVAVLAVFAVRAALAITAAVARLQFMDSRSKLRHTVFEIFVLFFEGPATDPPEVHGANCGSASVCHSFEKGVRAQLLNWKRASGDD